MKGKLAIVLIGFIVLSGCTQTTSDNNQDDSSSIDFLCSQGSDFKIVSAKLKQIQDWDSFYIVIENTSPSQQTFNTKKVLVEMNDSGINGANPYAKEISFGEKEEIGIGNLPEEGLTKAKIEIQYNDGSFDRSAQFTCMKS